MEFENLTDDTFLSLLKLKWKCNTFYYDLRVCKIKRRLKAKQIEIVNSVFKGQLPFKLNLLALSKEITGECKFYKSQPQMLMLNVDGVKLIFFKSGKFRLMGKYHATRVTARKLLRWFLPLLPP